MYDEIRNKIDKVNIRRYSDYGSDEDEIDYSKIDWCKYKIIVPTQKDKIDLMSAFEHIHHSDIDTEIITVNQLAHEYLKDSENIIVNHELFKTL